MDNKTAYLINMFAGAMSEETLKSIAAFLCGLLLNGIPVPNIRYEEMYCACQFQLYRKETGTDEPWVLISDEYSNSLAALIALTLKGLHSYSLWYRGLEYPADLRKIKAECKKLGIPGNSEEDFNWGKIDLYVQKYLEYEAAKSLLALGSENDI